MDAKNVTGGILIILGLLGLIPGILAIFNGHNMLGISAWAWIIIGAILFFAGVSIMRSVRPPYTQNTINKVD